MSAVSSDSYQQFLVGKRRDVGNYGRPCTTTETHPLLHPWQAQIVAWAVRTGRAAIWADTGLGKTIMSLEWARLSGQRALIVAPLAVCGQTVREAERIGIQARYLRADDGQPGIMVTNYEMVEHFNPATIDAVVLDEASILKQHDGKTRTRLIEHFSEVRARLACTATPAPNDPDELTNQAEFLGVMPRAEMLAAYFVNDSKNKGWRLKGHARAPMYRWMTSWAVAIRKPSDMGYDNTGYDLPALTIQPEVVHVDIPAPEGQLFAADLGGVGGRAEIRRTTLAARVARAADLVAAEADRQWVLWCGLNAEAGALAAAIPGAVNVGGNWTPEDKAKAFLDFAAGKIPYLITKPSMAAYGLNWQQCNRMAFVGITDSFEQYYQAIRRCWRYGQTQPVNVHVIVSHLESQIAANITRKETETSRLIDGLVAAMRQEWSAAP